MCLGISIDSIIFERNLTMFKTRLNPLSWTLHVLRVRDVRSTRGWRSRYECCWVLIGRSQLLLASQMNLRRSGHLALTTAGSRCSSSLTLTFRCHLGLGQLSVYCVVRLLICIGARRIWTTHLKRPVTTTTMMKAWYHLSNYLITQKVIDNFNNIPQITILLWMIIYFLQFSLLSQCLDEGANSSFGNISDVDEELGKVKIIMSKQRAFGFCLSFTLAIFAKNSVFFLMVVFCLCFDWNRFVFVTISHW